VCAVPFLLAGLYNAFASIAGGEAVWKGAGMTWVIAVCLLPACAACGFLAARRMGTLRHGALAGLVMPIAALLLPAAILLAISIRFEMLTPRFDPAPFAGCDLDPTCPDRLFAAFKQSSDWYQHWRRSILFLMPPMLVAGPFTGLLGALANIAWVRFRR